MGFLKNLFSKKEKVEIEEDLLENSDFEYKEESDNPVCVKCGMEIEKDLHGIRTFNGKKFHKICFRQIMKESKQKAFSPIGQTLNSSKS